MPSLTNKDIAYIALFAALTAALGLIPTINLPFLQGVPITAQTLGVMLAGVVLGSVRGGLALLLFAVLVAIGLPLLAGGRGGIGVFTGPTAGFIISFPIAAAVIGAMVEKWWHKINHVTMFLACLIGGVVLVYAIGIPVFAFVKGFGMKQASLIMMAYVPGDIFKAVLATFIGMSVKQAYPLIRAN